MRAWRGFQRWRAERRLRAIERLTDGRRPARQSSPADGNLSVYRDSPSGHITSPWG
jgi:hypothetical protein